ncbi:heme exporter protein CcmD [Gilvimarinus agarilyticus]|uniref:heme exporter protein CcmD n=1 Tax=Gilvimarinus sp. 2_MG-2023 TaxID=3062666 RepID=UPI001C090052|nr:heme exporter protein CcmD [Gilvimarinus sp. 2_MG-2023]MBU2887126.1 heme exporter protein CcmD [Gilvimarinus agarilyticus]MDO6571785.1 heme exporter protein CcmD [Gilvimarinus sp. 2_MG-2023]
MPSFKFDSLAEFIHMSGHGIYVWSCTAIALVLLTALIVHPLWLRKRQLQKLRQQQAVLAAQLSQHQQENQT